MSSLGTDTQAGSHVRTEVRVSGPPSSGALPEPPGGAPTKPKAEGPGALPLFVRHLNKAGENKTTSEPFVFCFKFLNRKNRNRKKEQEGKGSIGKRITQQGLGHLFYSKVPWRRGGHQGAQEPAEPRGESCRGAPVGLRRSAEGPLLANRPPVSLF